MTTRRGFTLIELLVVIAIIAILAAILFPVFAKAREKARQTSCLSNVKQLSLATMMYASDWDEYWPLYGYGSQTDAILNLAPPCGPQFQKSVWKWPSIVHPYIRNAGLFACPSWSTAKSCRANFPWVVTQWSYSIARGGNVHTTSTPYGGGQASVTCAQCPRLCPSEGNRIFLDGSWEGQKTGSAAAPANLIMVIEFKGGETGFGLPFTCWSACSQTGASMHTYWSEYTRLDRMTHNDGLNYGFADGHAKWMKEPDIGNWSRCAEDDR